MREVIIKDKPGHVSDLHTSSSRDKKIKTWRETIYFSYNSYKLSRVEKKHLENIAGQCPDSASVIGHTCDIGSESYNLELSKKRALTVATFLKDRGIEVTEVIGKGKCCPVSEDRKLNRRVELTLKKEVS